MDESNKTSILHLPHEVFCYILQYLPLSDCTAVAWTCRSLYNSYANGGRCRRVAVTMLDDLNCGFNALKHSHRTVHELVFRSASFQREHIRGWEPFWENLGHGITALTFHSCDISERTFCDILAQCPNLRSLTADNCNSLFMSGKLLDGCVGVATAADPPEGLLSVTELNLPNNRYLSDALFNRLTSFTPNVARLSLAGCHVSFHPAIYKRFYPPHILATASESVLTFQNVVKFLKRQSSKLRSLDFGNTLVDDNALRQLCRLPQLCLQGMCLFNCQQVTREGIEALCSGQRSLAALDVGKCSKLVDGAAQAVMRSLARLTRLNLGSCRSLTADGITDMGNLQGLAHLDLSACESLHSSGIERSLCGSPAPRLVSLNLSACAISEDAVVALARGQVHLRHLDLSNCRKGVTDVSLQAICRHLRWLRSLKLAFCAGVTDAGLAGLRASPAGEETLDGDGNLAEHGRCLSDISGLRELDLCACSEVTDAGLKAAVRFKELASLNLSVCHRISDSGLVSVGACNGSLEKLFLSQCREITDVGLVALVKCVPRLRHLDLQGCRKIGLATLNALRHWCPELHYLDVSVGPSVTADSLETLEAKLSRLHINKRHLQPNGVTADTFIFRNFS